MDFENTVDFGITVEEVYNNGQYAYTALNETDIEYYIQYATERIYNLRNNRNFVSYEAAEEWRKKLIKKATILLIEHWIKQGNDLSKQTISGTIGSINFSNDTNDIEYVPSMILRLLERADWRVSSYGMNYNDDIINDDTQYSISFKTGEKISTVSIETSDSDNLILLTKDETMNLISDLDMGIIEFSTGEMINQVSLSGDSNIIYESDVIDNKISTLETSIATKANSNDVYTKTEIDSQQQNQNTTATNYYTQLNSNKVNKTETQSGIITNILRDNGKLVLSNNKNQNITITSTDVIVNNELATGLAIANKQYVDAQDVLLSDLIDLNTSNIGQLLDIVNANFEYVFSGESPNEGPYPVTLNEMIQYPFTFPTEDNEYININGATVNIKQAVKELLIEVTLAITATSEPTTFIIINNGTTIGTHTIPANINNFQFTILLNDVDAGSSNIFNFRIESGNITITEKTKYKFLLTGAEISTESVTSDKVINTKLLIPAQGINTDLNQITTNKNAITDISNSINSIENTNTNQDTSISNNTTNIATNTTNIENLENDKLDINMENGTTDIVNKDMGINLDYYKVPTINNKNEGRLLISIREDGENGLQPIIRNYDETGENYIDTYEPLSDLAIVNKKYVDNNISDKLDIETVGTTYTTTFNVGDNGILYLGSKINETGERGEQTIYSNRISFHTYDSEGNAIDYTPTNDVDLTNKAYVDNNISNTLSETTPLYNSPDETELVVTLGESWMNFKTLNIIFENSNIDEKGVLTINTSNVEIPGRFYFGSTGFFITSTTTFENNENSTWRIEKVVGEFRKSGGTM